MADDPLDTSFLPLSHSDAAAAHPKNEGTNVCRAAALSASLGPSVAFRRLDEELEQIGIPPRVVSALRTWEPGRLIAGASRLEGPFPADDDGRVTAWQGFVSHPTTDKAVSYLVRLLGSAQERESVTAAAALWRILGGREDFRDRRAVLSRLDLDLPLPTPSGFEEPPIEAPESGLPPGARWDSRRWAVAYDAELGMPRRRIAPAVVARFASARLSWGLRSADPITLSLANAAFAPPATERPPPLPEPSPRPTSRPDAVSTMIHGTWAFRGDWWRPGGDFHSWILRHHRSMLYAGGARHLWSGRYSEKDRIRGADDLCDWVADRAPDGLRTLFGHSFGGEVAARAVLAGAATEQLVLLSCPVTPWVEAAVGMTDVIDVRLRLDPVLMLAAWPQKFPAGTALAAREAFWIYNHAATHDPGFWEDWSIAARTHL